MNRGLFHPPGGQLERYRAGALTGPARARVEAHVKHCHRCRSVLEELSALEDLLKQCRPDPIPPSFVDDLVDRMLAEPVRGVVRLPVATQTGTATGLRRPGPALAGAVLAMTLAALVGALPVVSASPLWTRGLVEGVKLALIGVRVVSAVVQAFILVVEPMRNVLLVGVLVMFAWCVALVARRPAEETLDRRKGRW